MIVYVLIFAAALVVAIGATPVARRIALSSGTMDIPSGRKVHATATPLLGGLGIYAGCAIALVLFGDRFYVPQLIGIFVGATFCSFLGIWDDRWQLPPLVKLAGQTMAGVILILSGIEVEFLHNPVLNVAATLLWVVGVTNALNLLDNMDGLSGGIAAICAAFFLVLAAGSGQYLVGSLAAALLGACLGFLYYNFNPATIFMGDTGSLFIGFVLAAVGIKLRFTNTDAVTWMIPVLVLGIPIFDTVLVVISRLRRGASPLEGGKDHVSHRLTRLGWTQREAVMALYLACGALGMVALFLMQATVDVAYLIGGIVVLVATLALLRLEAVPSKYEPK